MAAISTLILLAVSLTLAAERLHFLIGFPTPRVRNTYISTRISVRGSAGNWG